MRGNAPPTSGSGRRPPHGDAEARTSARIETSRSQVPPQRLPLRGGVLVIDKPRGPTSHDVVAHLRRALGVRRIGHAGTLDPMASGVLVVLLGEATKLAPYLTAEDKAYHAHVALGVATDSLDAEGHVTAAQPLPGWLDRELALLSSGGERGGPALAASAPRIAAALAAERARREQTPPTFSAIKVAGRRSYALARAGEAVELSPRLVDVRSLDLGRVVLGDAAAALRPAGHGSHVAPAVLELTLEVSKGYYVRSLARDLGGHLTVPAHLAALRRTRSGAFSLELAVPPDADREELAAALQPTDVAAARSLPVARLTDHGTRRARLGQPLSTGDFTASPPDAVASAWFSPEGQLVAIGASADGSAHPSAPDPSNEDQERPARRFSVLRGFNDPVSTSGGEDA